MGQAQMKPMTIFDFIEWEPLQEGKHEFMDGQIVAMAGARPTHNRLCNQLGYLVTGRLRGSKACEGLGTDQAVYLHESGDYVYPDYVVTCDPKFLLAGNNALENPVIVFEVLSPSTRSYDQRNKLHAYMQCPSLQQIVFIDSARIEVTSWYRVGEGWQMSVPLDNLSDSLHLPVIDYTLALTDLYEPVIAADPEFGQNPMTAEEEAAIYG